MLIKKTLITAAVSVITLIILLTAIIVPVSAENNNGVKFTVQAIIPENQINKSLTYFDLLMIPGQEQILSVNVANNTDEEIIVDATLRAASTNRNGSIEYQVRAEPDETLKVPFDTISQTVSEIVIPPNETRKADIVVTMPEEEFDGVILGSIVFTKREEENASQGVSINNQYSYVIGVKLSETDREILPDFRLKSIEPTLINYRKAVVSYIHNPVPLIVKDADVTAHIYTKDDSVPLFSLSKESIDMAPNSVYPMPIEWEGRNMEPGDYTLSVSFTHQNKTWDWNENFTIENKQAEDINSGALDSPTVPSVPSESRWYSNCWWIILLIIVMLILLWFAFILGKRRRDEDEDKNKKEYN